MRHFQTKFYGLLFCALTLPSFAQDSNFPYCGEPDPNRLAPSLPKQSEEDLKAQFQSEMGAMKTYFETQISLKDKLLADANAALLKASKDLDTQLHQLNGTQKLMDDIAKLTAENTSLKDKLKKQFMGTIFSTIMLLKAHNIDMSLKIEDLESQDGEHPNSPSAPSDKKDD